MPTPPQPPRVSPMKMGSQGRPGFTPPKPGPDAQIEVEKFDPATLARPPRPPRPNSEQEIMANAEPIDIRKPLPGAVAADIQKRETEAKAQPAAAPPDPMGEPLDKMVPDSLIARLEARFGIQPETFYDAELSAMGQKMTVSFRTPGYDDYIWSMAVIERKLLNQEDASLLQTDAQRNNMMEHLVACRAIVRLEGAWLWEVFGREAEIRSVVPGWDGKTWDIIPDFIRGTMAMATYELFRKRLHADLLFELEKAVKNATAPKKADEEPAPDPSSAA